MGPRCQVSRRLHEEHVASRALLRRVEAAFAGPEERAAPERVALAASLARALETEVGAHFDFEERELFGRLAEAGAGDLADLLAEEHATIRAVAAEFVPLARDAQAGTLDTAGGAALRRAALELAERLGAHIDKEEAALLAAVDDALDDETDRALVFAYASA